jgi:ribosome-binding factor A
MSWIRLAADLEQAKAFIDAMNEMDEDPPKAAE